MIIAILLIIYIQNKQEEVNAQEPEVNGITPVLKITGDSEVEIPLRMDVLSIDIHVTGSIAVTTLDFTYFNPNNRILEGEFSFPLANGISVSRFALDIGGKLREGVVVEKEKGRTTYEAIARKRIDPGLLEMTEGNNFRARIFPLPAKNYRRIVIAFEQELSDQGNFDIYRLPLMIHEPVGKISIHAEVIKDKADIASDNQVKDLNFKQFNNAYVADFDANNYIPDKQIVFTFPRSDKQPEVFTAERDENTSWFYINIKPELIQKDKKLPETITLLWDNSRSAMNRDIVKELALLDRYFNSIGNLTVNLIPFNIKTGNARSFMINSGNWDSLRTELENMIYDGGTTIGVFDFRKFTTDEILLFTDGLSTYGNNEPGAGKIPVYTVNSCLVANHSFLEGLAQKSGGAYIDLTGSDISEALDNMQHLRNRFISYETENGLVGDIYPSKPCLVGKTFSMAGIMASNNAILKINFGFGTTITSSLKVILTSDHAADPKLLSRIWAQKVITGLSMDEKKNEKQITAIGKEFGIVTQNTSLIVLETIEDYLQYEIVPPSEMQQEYYQRINLKSKNDKDSFEKYFEQILEYSKIQTDWWNTDFPIKSESLRGIRPDSRVDGDTIVIVEEQVNAMILPMVVEEDVMIPPPPPPPASSLDADEREVTLEMREVELNAPLVLHKDEKRAENSIKINAWDPETPYLKVLEYSKEGEEYAAYIRLKKEYGTTPSFYLDIADYFFSKGKTDTAVRILSNIADLSIETPQLLRVMGKKLMVMKQYEDAVSVFRKVLDMKGEEPQSYRDLGLALEAAGKLNEAVETMYEVVKKEWDIRFSDIEIIVLNEINNILNT
ncbi:trypsin [bacterium]|nr:MAG: trypsin [bacterium]